MIELHGKDLQYSLVEREKYLYSTIEFPENYVLLRTCNRVELYSGDGSISSIITGHLFRVVSGLESALIGETAIQGQVKEAYRNAINNNTISPGLHKLFQNALRVGKKVRSKTKISQGAMSHGQAAIEILISEPIDLFKSNIMIIGVNNINISVTKYLVKTGIKTIFVANRSFNKALELSKELGCHAIKFDQFYQKLNTMDILFSTTSAPHLILKNEKFHVKHNMIIFDLAVPRDIDPEIEKLSNVTLYNIEQIENKIDQNLKKRQSEFKLAQRIVHEETQKFILKNQIKIFD